MEKESDNKKWTSSRITSPTNANESSCLETNNQTKRDNRRKTLSQRTPILNNSSKITSLRSGRKGLSRMKMRRMMTMMRNCFGSSRKSRSSVRENNFIRYKQNLIQR